MMTEPLAIPDYSDALQQLPLVGAVHTVFPTVMAAQRVEGDQLRHLRDYVGVTVVVMSTGEATSNLTLPEMSHEQECRVRAIAGEWCVSVGSVVFTVLSIIGSGRVSDTYDEDQGVPLTVLVVGAPRNVMHVLHAAWQVVSAKRSTDLRNDILPEPIPLRAGGFGAHPALRITGDSF